MSRLSHALASLGREQRGLEGRLMEYASLLVFYNKRINLVARTDEQHVVDRHISHCLSLARHAFPTGSRVVDWGTGGGLPLIPLALTFPDVPFVGVDSVGKKIQAVGQMVRTLGLHNVSVWHGRAEAFSQPHTHSVSRATAPLDHLWNWHRRNATSIAHEPGEWPTGLICLKGGDLADEIASVESPSTRVTVEPVGFQEPFFSDKYVVTVRDTLQ